MHDIDVLILDGGQLMKWITASDLTTWSGRDDARTDLPELIGDLIRASHSRRFAAQPPECSPRLRRKSPGACRIRAGDGIVHDVPPVEQV
jgi:hypothetical protein